MITDLDPDADLDAVGGAPVVELIGLRRSFPGPPEVHAVRGVDLTVRAGEYVSIIGPSGSGKSTLLHLLGLLDQPTGGTYRLDGEDVSALTERRRSAVRGSRIGFVFQAFHLLQSRTVLDNVMLSMLYQAVPRRQRRERAMEALNRVGLDHRREFTPRTLSGGERQRVAIARALAGRPSLLLADEPTGNLDRANASGVLELFDDLHADGLTLAVITHDDVVSRRADRRVRMTDGVLGPEREEAS
ncbi:ABC transporter ATP-binding protein [Microlunatus sp. GCM10028923]|uniref:ABC transporter ATP-binding protein n=1 Tax=Microlunatus sp. GCM10028923 TaxID=3273400 RepID=UPI00360B1929